MKPSSCSVLLASALLALLPAGLLAQESLSVFSAKAGFADGWKSSAWNGPVTNQVEGPVKGTTVLQISLAGNAQPYAGVILVATPGSGLDLTDKVRQSGVVTLDVKPGKTVQGAAATAPQPLQLALSFLTKDGETVHGAFNTQATVTTAESGTRISFPVATALKGVKSPDSLASISSVRLQYIDAPLAGFAIIDCTIKAE